MSKTRNEHIESVGPLFAEIPKAVWAAIAISALTTGGEQWSEAHQRVLAEWDILHANGIVPQPVPLRLRRARPGANW